jgi:hypothetical protein
MSPSPRACIPVSGMAGLASPQQLYAAGPCPAAGRAVEQQLLLHATQVAASWLLQATHLHALILPPAVVPGKVGRRCARARRRVRRGPGAVWRADRVLALRRRRRTAAGRWDRKIGALRCRGCIVGDSAWRWAQGELLPACRSSSRPPASSPAPPKLPWGPLA